MSDDTLIDLETKLIATKNGRLRMDAGLAYMTNPDCASLDDLSQDERFRSVSKRTLERWCAEDKWVERRQQFLSRWAEHAKERLGSALSRHRTEEFQQLLRVRELALSKLEDPMLEPKSWEGVAKVLVEINRRIENVAVSVGNEVLPSGLEKQETGPSRLDPLEREVLRKRLLGLRREKLRAIEPETTDSTDDDRIINLVVGEPSNLTDQPSSDDDCDEDNQDIKESEESEDIFVQDDVPDLGLDQ